VEGTHWPRHWSAITQEAGERVASSDAQSFSGRRSLIVRGRSDAAVGARSSHVPARGGSIYEACVQVLVEAGRARMYLEFWDGAGSRLAAHFKETTFRGGWHRVDVRAEAPADTSTVTVMLNSGTRALGIAYFDDVVAREVTPLPIDRFGTAAFTAAIRGVTVMGERLFVSSRSPVDGHLRLAEVDPHTASVVTQVDLDVGGAAGGALAGDGTYVYIVPAGGSDVWRFDPRTGEASAWARIGDEAVWAYDLRVVGEHLYLATYPDGHVRRFGLGDGLAESYGAVSSSQYATAVHADDRHVCGGSTEAGRLVRWPIDGGVPVEISPAPDPADGGIVAMARSGGALVVASGSRVICIDSNGGQVVHAAPDDDHLGHLAVGPDATVYALARRGGALYRVDDAGLTSVAVLPGEGAYEALEVTADGLLVAVTISGDVRTVDPDGATSEFSLVDGAFAYPDAVHSMLLHSRTQQVWVAGRDAITVHDPATGRHTMFRTPGEAGALVEGSDGTVYAALNGSGHVVRYDPESHRRTDMGVIGHGQRRITGMHFDAAREQLLITSSPTGPDRAGALTFVDPATRELDVHVGLLPEQRVMGIAVSGSTAYIVGDTDADSAEPTQSAAEVGAVDLHSRTLLWRGVLEPSWESYETVLIDEGTLYLMGRCPSGHWFSYDLTTREIVRRGALGGRGAFGLSRGRVFSWARWAGEIRELPSAATAEESLVHAGVEPGWAGNPMFSFTSNGRETWGADGTELARFPLIA
ncbi:MAG: SMP-30/gluconolactonase/LRE family protein, partial [Propionibacterium sp.]|nr:SMP-30/gluconolactonase/LRE family protein [Propionibacterium sp.]